MQLGVPLPEYSTVSIISTALPLGSRASGSIWKFALGRSTMPPDDDVEADTGRFSNSGAGVVGEGSVGVAEDEPDDAVGIDVGVV